MASIHYVVGSTEGSNKTTIAAGSSGSANVKIHKPANYYDQTNVFDSTPHNGDDAQKAILGYAFGKDTNTLIAQRSSDPVGSKRPLRNGSIYPAYVRSINYIESASTVLTATAIREGKFNVSTGKFATSYPATATDAFGNDNAARASFDSPGTITFMNTGSSPTNHALEAKG